LLVRMLLINSNRLGVHDMKHLFHAV